MACSCRKFFKNKVLNLLKILKTFFFFFREASVWRHRRKLLVTGFHVKILQDFLPIFNVHTEKLLRKVDAQFSDGNSANHHHQQKSSVIIKDMRTLYEDLTLDIVKGRIKINFKQQQKLQLLLIFQKPPLVWTSRPT